MAHTPEQRDKHALCSASKKDGSYCRKFAGEGTAHRGSGRCKYHLGNTAQHNKRAIKQELVQHMVQEATMGEPVDEITAVEALAQELRASSGHCGWLRQTLASMTKEDLGTPAGMAVVNLYAAERDRRVHIAKLCQDADVDEAQITVLSAQVAVLGAALQRAADRAGMDAQMKLRLGAYLREELSEAQQAPALPGQA